MCSKTPNSQFDLNSSTNYRSKNFSAFFLHIYEYRTLSLTFIFIFKILISGFQFFCSSDLITCFSLVLYFLSQIFDIRLWKQIYIFFRSPEEDLKSPNVSQLLILMIQVKIDTDTNEQLFKILCYLCMCVCAFAVSDAKIL